MRTVKQSEIMKKQLGRPPKPPEEVKNIMISVTVEPAVKAELEELAALTHSSVSRILRVALAEHMERQKAAKP
jgi:ribbon-helix-helix CopG family protein